MNSAYVQFLATAAAGELTHVALVDESGTPVTSRLAVTWQPDGTGLIRPDADTSFSVSAGDTVAGWRAYDAETGGTDYDGKALPIQPFTTDGTYVLTAADTYILHQDVA